jgi:tetratricopeptide (TPR) repeat protein
MEGGRSSSSGRPGTGSGDNGMQQHQQQQQRRPHPMQHKAEPPIPPASAADTSPSFSSPPPPLAPREPAGPEDAARDMERGVHALLEASARAAAGGDWPTALERAKEASRRERALTRHREAHGLVDHVNAELGYAVHLNLAAAYQGHGMLDEALQAYQVLVRNKALHPLNQQPIAAVGPGAIGGGGWLRVDMGNVCYAQGKYAQAVKMYRMALDQVPNAHKEVGRWVHACFGVGVGTGLMVVLVLASIFGGVTRPAAAAATAT